MVRENEDAGVIRSARSAREGEELGIGAALQLMLTPLLEDLQTAVRRLDESIARVERLGDRYGTI